MIIVPLKTGEPCPCCGQPIMTKNPDLLYLLGWIRETACFAPITLEQLRAAQNAQEDAP